MTPFILEAYYFMSDIIAVVMQSLQILAGHLDGETNFWEMDENLFRKSVMNKVDNF